ncbi:hypothetical protein [Sunxiuqinia rutila]
MVQEILTYLILLIAIAVIVRKVYRVVRSVSQAKRGTSEPDKCGICATGCAIKDMKENQACPPGTGFSEKQA